MTVDPNTIDGESPEGAALVDAEIHLITALGDLEAGQRAAFQAACAAARIETLIASGPSVADVWGALHDLVLAVRMAAGDLPPASADDQRLTAIDSKRSTS